MVVQGLDDHEYVVGQTVKLSLQLLEMVDGEWWPDETQLAATEDYMISQQGSAHILTIFLMQHQMRENMLSITVMAVPRYICFWLMVIIYVYFYIIGDYYRFISETIRTLEMFVKHYALAGGNKFWNKNRQDKGRKGPAGHCLFTPIAQRTPSIITSSCWKSTVGDIMACGIDRKKGCVQNVTCSLALTIRKLYDYKMQEYVDVLTSQSLSLSQISTSKSLGFI